MAQNPIVPTNRDRRAMRVLGSYARTASVVQVVALPLAAATRASSVRRRFGPRQPR